MSTLLPPTTEQAPYEVPQPPPVQEVAPAAQAGPPAQAFGPPPPNAPPPSAYAEYVLAAVKARQHPRTNIAGLWAQLATADATHRLATALERLNVFLGVEDRLDDDDDEPRLVDVAAGGLVTGVTELVTRLEEKVLGALPPEVREQVMAELLRPALEAVAAKKAPKKK